MKDFAEVGQAPSNNIKQFMQIAAFCCDRDLLNGFFKHLAASFNVKNPKRQRFSNMRNFMKLATDMLQQTSLGHVCLQVHFSRQRSRRIVSILTPLSSAKGLAATMVVKNASAPKHLRKDAAETASAASPYGHRQGQAEQGSPPWINHSPA
ncbi:hypothetical protein [Synechococcus sp. MIT S9451]|uniref:hypothetical protein n=1 Tax=Synechococcus sp. MIT S9451 TaxID=3082543 RepID=UPI0039B5996F